MNLPELTGCCCLCSFVSSSTIFCCCCCIFCIFGLSSSSSCWIFFSISTMWSSSSRLRSPQRCSSSMETSLSDSKQCARWIGKSFKSTHHRFYARANTRGNTYKLVNHSFHYDLRKHFSLHVLLIFGNSLPNSVVDTCTMNAFKAWLDKFWLHQVVKYNFTADLTGTGKRSEEVTML